MQNPRGTTCHYQKLKDAKSDRATERRRTKAKKARFKKTEAEIGEVTKKSTEEKLQIIKDSLEGKPARKQKDAEVDTAPKTQVKATDENQ